MDDGPGEEDLALPDGVRVNRLTTHADRRGRFTEVFRSCWPDSDELVQWNAVSSVANVLRGVHCHRRHADYLTILHGRAIIGLCDLRSSSATHRLACTVDLTADAMSAIRIPTGVAHGFYFPVPSIHLYAVTHYWNPDDELRCHWADPGLEIPWPDVEPVLSDLDNAAGSLAEMETQLEQRPVTGPTTTGAAAGQSPGPARPPSPAS